MVYVSLRELYHYDYVLYSSSVNAERNILQIIKQNNVYVSRKWRKEDL